MFEEDWEAGEEGDGPYIGTVRRRSTAGAAVAAVATACVSTLASFCRRQALPQPLLKVAAQPLLKVYLPPPALQAGGEELADALGALSLEAGAHGPLRGLPTPAGTHVRCAPVCLVFGGRALCLKAPPRLASPAADSVCPTLPALPACSFDDEGQVAAVSPRQRVYLRGTAHPTGQHLRFEDE